MTPPAKHKESAQDYLRRQGAPHLFEQLAYTLIRERPEGPDAIRRCLHAALDAADITCCGPAQPASPVALPEEPVGAAEARRQIEAFAVQLDPDDDGISMHDIQRAQEQRLEPPREDCPELSETKINTIEGFGMTPRQGEKVPIRGDFRPGPKDALLVIDVQYDFCPGGALATEAGISIIPTVNALIDLFPADRVFYAQDWHPPDHWSFASQHPGCKPHDMVRWTWKGKDLEQVLWPDHCVIDSPGAQFRPELTLLSGATVVRKGHQRSVDSYSILYGADHETSTGLRPILKERDIQHCYVCGIAYDFCVKFSAMDAVDCGHTASVIRDACACVALPGTMEAAAKQLSQKGVTMMMVTQHEAMASVPASVALDAFSLIAHADLDGDQRICRAELLQLAECYFRTLYNDVPADQTWSRVTPTNIREFKGKFGVA
eukprot:TRINITY_DN3989_c0_g2_i1.p1 TRINITY_DN3989_c0_g2~~TRINITY_DN3989_c0_g2_i1.p1  ORF type:complete len:443 (+),score=93.11 TRINITY_DN3989_c0_g2_i1:31-1329(+)